MTDASGATPAPENLPTAATPPAKSNMLIIVIIIVVAAMIVAIVAIFVLKDDGKDDSEGEAVGAGSPAAAQQVQTEPISTATDPFAPPGQVGQDLAVTPVQTAAPTTVDGGKVGLYGGTMSKVQCDKGQLAKFLADNPDKGAQWAQVLGISPDTIGTYIAGLTPVILRSDTAVTNHGFKNGVANPIPAVLQAGTAVLVDEYGKPVTKCYCGNPLKPPTFTTTTTTTTTGQQPTTTKAGTTTTTYYEPPVFYGPTWPTWNPTSITIIQVNVTIIEVFILVDPESGQTFERPRGTGGEADKPVNAPTETTTTTAGNTPPPSGTATTRPQTTTTRPPATTTTTYPTTTTTYPTSEPDCVDEFGNMVPCPGSDGVED